MDHAFPHLNRFISYRIVPLRSLRRWLIARGVGYVDLDGNERAFWSVSGKHIPRFSSALTLSEVDEALRGRSEWTVLKAQIQAGDKVFPFAINVDTLAMRLGYVVLRQDKPLGGVVAAMS